MRKVASIVLVVVAAAGAARAQRPELEERVDEAVAAFDEALRSKEYDRIWTGVGELASAWSPALNESLQARIIAALGKGLRILDREGGIAIRSAQALGDMGPEAAPPLAAALRDRRIAREEENLAVRLAVLRALGATRSLRDVKTLLPFLADEEPRVVIAASEGLGYYGRSVPEAVRKTVAEALIRALESAHGAAAAQGTGGSFDKRYALVAYPLMEAITRVTGVTANSPAEWRKWFNDNKKKKWDP